MPLYLSSNFFLPGSGSSVLVELELRSDSLSSELLTENFLLSFEIVGLTFGTGARFPTGEDACILIGGGFATTR